MGTELTRSGPTKGRYILTEILRHGVQDLIILFNYPSISINTISFFF